ncbi:WD40-like repeat protein [Geoglobus ahangari]|uniref:WD40-like repeat protein n=1 Tax=Geoglobus ahangari TaxID=113653 RepID=A0A0F7IF17_9EURY|nr:PQQ-binding-like beta-propeller repeat protein [Geoglobus ahangari]AKG91304.1 WD40-like repeat protein [Geoglobus ahangari]
MLITVLLLGLANTSSAAGELANSPWPMFHHDLNHTGRSPYNATGEPDLKWVFSPPYGVRSAPIIDSSGTIYVGYVKLYAVYPNGTQKWSFPVYGGASALFERSAAAIASDGTIYIGSDNSINFRKLFALYPNGTEKWNFSAGEAVLSAPAIGDDGTVYFGSDDNKFYALYPNGTEKWSYATVNDFRSSPAVDSNGVVYVGSDDRYVYAFYPNGTLKWRFLTGDGVKSSPAIAGDTVYVGSANGSYATLYAIYAANGSLKWSYTDVNDDCTIETTPAVGEDGTVYIGFPCSDMFRAFYPNGTLKWEKNLGSGIYSSPVIDASGYIYVGAGDNIYSLYPNGTVRWTKNLGIGNRVYELAIGSDGTIYAIYNNKLYALADMTPPRVSIQSPQNTVYPTSIVQINVSARDPSGVSTVIAQVDGATNITLTYQNGHYIGSTPALSDGQHYIRIYANDSYGNLNSTQVVYFNISIPKLANSPWPMFHHDLNHTGRSQYAGHGEVNEKWNFTMGVQHGFSPVIASDGTVYMGSDDKYLYALYPNGTLKWGFSAGGLIRSSPAVASDGTVYFGTCTNARFFALHPNGTEKWNFSTGDLYGIYSSPAIASDGTIYFGARSYNGYTYYGTFYALYPNGTLKWNITTNYYVDSSPAIASDGTIYIQCGLLYSSNNTFKFCAINPDGTEKWNFSIKGGTGGSTPAIASDGTVYVGTSLGHFYAFYPNGTLKWNISFSDLLGTTVGIYSTPAIASDGTVYVLVGGTTAGYLFALHPNGTEKWNFTLGSVTSLIGTSPIVDSNGVIYVGSSTGNVYALNPDGTLKWTFNIGSAAGSPAMASDGTIYIASAGNKLHALSDLTPPRVTILSPQSLIYGTSTIAINVSVSDPSGVNAVIAQIDGSQNVTLSYSNGHYVGSVNLADGRHYIRIYASDSFGNMNSSEMVYFSVDTAPPTMEFLPPTPANNTVTSRNYLEVNLSVQEPNLNELIFNWNGTNYSIYDDSLVLYLNFNNNSAIGENSTHVVDVSGYRNNGTINGAVYVEGRYGKALKFDGINDYVDLGNKPEFQITNNITIAAWVKHNTGSPGSWEDIIMKGNTAYGLQFYQTEGYFTFHLTAAGGGWKNLPSTVKPQAGVWYHVVGTYDGKTQRIYINGVLNNEVNDTFTINTNSYPLTIGYKVALDNSYLNGVVDDVRIYNRALTPEEVKMLYYSTLWKHNDTDWFFYTNITNLSEGKYTYYALANDTVGNRNASKTLVNVIDTTPPQISVAAPSTIYRATSANITVTVTDAHPLSYTAYRNGSLIASGSYSSASPFNISVNTTALGYWTYTIRASDLAGNVNSTSVLIRVVNHPPVAMFAVSKTSAKTNEILTFNASQSYDPDGTIVNYTWDFGDGGSGRGAVVTHAYTAPGTYTVNLTVTDSDGAVSHCVKTVTIKEAQTQPSLGTGYVGGGGYWIKPPEKQEESPAPETEKTEASVHEKSSGSTETKPPSPEETPATAGSPEVTPTAQKRSTIQPAPTETAEKVVEEKEETTTSFGIPGFEVVVALLAIGAALMRRMS